MDFVFSNEEPLAENAESSVDEHEGNFSQEIVIGANPEFYEDWHIVSKIVMTFTVIFVVSANSVVIGLYHQARRRATMHEIHVCHLAVVDLLAGVTAAFPMVSGYVKAFVDLGPGFLIPCFITSLSTMGLNVMAIVICNIVSYDRLRLLQLGIRYHMVHTRVFSIARLTIAWIADVSVTLLIALIIILSNLGKPCSNCAYSVNTGSYAVKIIMTSLGVVPLAVLVVINCLVRRELRQLEERHPHVINRSRTSSMGRAVHNMRAATNATDAMDSENSQVLWTPSREPTSTGLGPSVATSDETMPQGRTEVGSAGQMSKSLWRNFKSDRSLSRRASTSIFISTFTFILCLSPMSALLIIEAWMPDRITTSTHRWHMFFTIIRCSVDPFLFARSVPSFRMQYGTTVLKSEQKWRWFRWARCLCYGPLYFLDHSVVAEVKERLDRKRRGSPAAIVRLKEPAADPTKLKEVASDGGRPSFPPLGRPSQDGLKRTASHPNNVGPSDSRIVLNLRAAQPQTLQTQVSQGGSSAV